MPLFKTLRRLGKLALLVAGAAAAACTPQGRREGPDAEGSPADASGADASLPDASDSAADSQTDPQADSTSADAAADAADAKPKPRANRPPAPPGRRFDKFSAE